MHFLIKILAPINDDDYPEGSNDNDGDYTKKQTRFITDSAKQKWASAVRDDYKLTLSGDEPWLFDLNKDPHELINFYGDSNYTAIAQEMQEELYDAMFLHKFPLAEEDVVYFGQPGCYDTKNQLSLWKKRTCLDLANQLFSPGCQWRVIYEQCPVACNRCCEDSTEKLIISGVLQTCEEVSSLSCENGKISKFCPRTCNACPGQALPQNVLATSQEQAAPSEIDGNDDQYGAQYGPGDL